MCQPVEIVSHHDIYTPEGGITHAGLTQLPGCVLLCRTQSRRIKCYLSDCKWLDLLVRLESDYKL